MSYDHDYEPGAFGVCRRCGEERHGPAGSGEDDLPTDVSDLQARLRGHRAMTAGSERQAERLRTALKAVLAEFNLGEEADDLAELEASGAGLSDTERARLRVVVEAREALAA